MLKKIEADFDKGVVTVSGSLAGDSSIPLFDEDFSVKSASASMKDGVLSFELQIVPTKDLKAETVAGPEEAPANPARRKKK